MAEEERLLRPKKRIGFMRKKRVLGYYVRVDEHGREGEGQYSPQAHPHPNEAGERPSAEDGTT